MLLANCKHKCFFVFSEMQIYVSILLCKHLNRKQLIINKKLGPYKFWVIALSLNGHWVNVSKKLKKSSTQVWYEFFCWVSFPIKVSPMLYTTIPNPKLTSTKGCCCGSCSMSFERMMLLDNKSIYIYMSDITIISLWEALLLIILQ